TGNPLADLLLGLPFSASKTVLQNNDAQFLFISNQTAGFFQDDWRLTPRLTLTLGMRYEYLFPATEKRNHMSNFNPATNQLLVAGQNGQGSQLYNADPHDYAPRIGFAWSPSSSSPWALRGGYGLFYELTEINQVLGMFQNVPFYSTYTVQGDGNN